MNTNFLHLNKVFSEVRKTIFELGEQRFYEQMTLLNSQEVLDTSISSDAFTQQTFLFLSQNPPQLVLDKLSELRQNKEKIKISQNEYDFLVNVISDKFLIQKEKIILKDRCPSAAIKDARMLFFAILKNYYNITGTELAQFHSWGISWINVYIRKFNELDDRIPSHFTLKTIYKEIIQDLKTAKTSNNVAK